MGVLKSVSAGDIIARGSVRESDVARMRQAYYDDGIITAAEAELLFQINTETRAQDASWPWFFVEAITDFVVNQAAPEGYVTAENADWLIHHIGRDGAVDTKTELDLLVHVLDKARWSPERLVRFALEQIQRAVLEGEGPLRTGGTLQKGVIADAEVDLVRRILYAFGGDGNISITRAEAEVLLAIEEALDPDSASPAWTDLFSKALTNLILSASGYAPPTREEALRSEAWLKRRGDLSPVAFLSAMVTSSISSVWDGYHTQTPEEIALQRLERQRIEIITNDEISDSDAAWLAERLLRDNRLTPTETALLELLHREQPVLHPDLMKLIGKAGVAA